MAFDNTWQPLEKNRGGIILDDDGDNGEDDGDIKLPSTQTINYCNCFDIF